MKYSLILQHSQEDCGAACVASIAQYYGRRFSIYRVREALGTGQLRTTLLGLRRGSESLGFYTRSVVASSAIFDKLDQVPLPAIIHWRGEHWVVLYGKKGRKYAIADPAIGMRYLSQEELTQAWTDGVMLLLQPDPSRFFHEPEDKISGLDKFFQRLIPYRGIIFEAFLCALVVGLLSLVSPLFIQILTDEVLIQGDSQLITSVTLAVIIMYIISAGLSLVENNLIAHFAEGLELGLTLEFVQQILRLPLTYYEARRSGEVVSRLQDIQEINNLISELVISLPSNLIVAIVSLILMVIYSFKLTILAIIVAITMLLSALVSKPILQQRIYKEMVLESEAQGVLVESFKGALTLKTLNAAAHFWQEFQAKFGTLANLMFKNTQISIFNQIFSRLVSDIGSAILLGFGGTLVLSQQLSIGQLLAFISLKRNLNYLITDLIDVVDDFIRAQTAHYRLQEVINATLETENDSKKPWVTLADNTEIICEKLNFYYPSRLEFFENISLTIPGGKVTALIGKSGCGKSTMAKLIAGLYPPKSGNISLGSYNQQDLCLDSLRQQVILVPQDTHFWSRSIIDNFRLAYSQVSFEEIVQACKITGADEFISKLPEKYQTILGEFGCNLSGGQRQRLALARALVLNSPILILDESTSALDPMSGAEILDELLWHRQGKTTILISHKFQVVNRADWLILLEQGRLQYQGIYDEKYLDFLAG